MTNAWKSMASAPRNGKHLLLAVKDGSFVRVVEGTCYNGKWVTTMGSDQAPLCWMNKTPIPQVFLPWTEEYAYAQMSDDLTSDEVLDKLCEDLRPMNGCNEFDRAVAVIKALRDRHVRIMGVRDDN